MGVCMAPGTGWRGALPLQAARSLLCWQHIRIPGRASKPSAPCFVCETLSIGLKPYPEELLLGCERRRGRAPLPAEPLRSCAAIQRAELCSCG